MNKPALLIFEPNWHIRLHLVWVNSYASEQMTWGTSLAARSLERRLNSKVGFPGKEGAWVLSYIKPKYEFSIPYIRPQETNDKKIPEETGQRFNRL